jgi:hypothetical protein
MLPTQQCRRLGLPRSPRDAPFHTNLQRIGRWSQLIEWQSVSASQEEFFVQPYLR